jgi:hypothetical protein
MYPPYPPQTTPLDSHLPYSHEPEEIPANYPLIIDWLKNVDAGPRSDGHNFLQFGESLLQNGYIRLFQLADEARRENGPKELAEMCPGMTLGLARLPLGYAAKDCRNIKSQRTALNA